jgi:hypothetical protein
VWSWAKFHPTQDGRWDEALVVAPIAGVTWCGDREMARPANYGGHLFTSTNSNARAMPDDDLTRENVIAVSFSEDANAFEALSRLKELDAKGEVGVRGAAVVTHTEDGTIAIEG